MEHVSALKLNLKYDAVQLKHELHSVLGWGWQAHGNKSIYTGRWSGLALRNTTGEVNNIDAPLIYGNYFVNTPLLAHCPYFQTLLDGLHCPIGSARLLRLNAGAIIDEHVDGGLCYEFGEARLHIPVATNPQLEFVLNKNRIVMAVGECWYINANMPHAVANRGTTDRVHLVIDVGVNQWVQSRFESALGREAPVIIQRHF